MTYSTQQASYAAGGWYEAGIDAESPWVKGSISSDVASTVNAGDVYVTGRYTHSLCQLQLPEKLEPHPDLMTAVHKALALKGDDKRRNALKAVFGRWGYFFVDGVTMGGTKCMTSVIESSSSVSIACSHSFFITVLIYLSSIFQTSATKLNTVMQSELMRKIRLSDNHDANTSDDFNYAHFSSGTLMTRVSPNLSTKEVFSRLTYAVLHI